MEFEFERLLSRVKPLKDTEIQIHFPSFKKSKPHLFLSANLNQLQRWRGCSRKPKEEVAILLGLSKSSVEVIDHPSFPGHCGRGLLGRS